MAKDNELKKADSNNGSDSGTAFETIAVFFGVILSVVGLIFHFRFVDIAGILYKAESVNELYVAQLAAVLLGLSLFTVGLVLVLVVVFKLKYFKR